MGAKQSQPTTTNEMPNAPTVTRSKFFLNRGYENVSKIVNTMQGMVVSADHIPSDTKVVIKITSRRLHDRGAAIINGVEYLVDENILAERSVIRYLSDKDKCPPSIVKYVDFFKSQSNYYLVQEFGGKHTLHDFARKVHRMIESGKVSIADWRETTKVIFQQMLEAVDFLHSHNCCHFDLSLENFLISEVEVELKENERGQSQIGFVADTIQIKLCDFGLSRVFEKGSDFQCRRFVGKPTYWSPEIASHDDHSKFNAKSNDIWCLGVCLYMLAVGGHPFQTASAEDASFKTIVNDGVEMLLKKWKMNHYVSSEMAKCMRLLFRYEGDRVDLEGLRQSEWLNQTTK